MADIKRGTKIRLGKPSGVPPALHGEEMKIAEVVQIGAYATAYRLRDPAAWDGATEMGEGDLPHDDVHCPFTVTRSDFEVIDDE